MVFGIFDENYFHYPLLGPEGFFGGKGCSGGEGSSTFESSTQTVGATVFGQCLNSVSTTGQAPYIAW